MRSTCYCINYQVRNRDRAREQVCVCETGVGVSAITNKKKKTTRNNNRKSNNIFYEFDIVFREHICWRPCNTSAAKTFEKGNKVIRLSCIEFITAAAVADADAVNVIKTFRTVVFFVTRYASFVEIFLQSIPHIHTRHATLTDPPRKVCAGVCSSIRQRCACVLLLQSFYFITFHCIVVIVSVRIVSANVIETRITVVVVVWQLLSVICEVVFISNCHLSVLNFP